MAITVSWPTGLPGPSDENFELTETPRVRTSKFGDGYEQRALDGINARPRLFQMEWPNVTTAQKNTILNFLRTMNGVEGFFYTPPRETTPIKVKCPTWSHNVVSGPFWSIKVTFEEVFDA